MYKYLLCRRYLRTRYIAAASIISVTLGVATMIVVNSVMAGFADKMRDRIRGFALRRRRRMRPSFDGFEDYDRVMARIQERLPRAKIEAMGIRRDRDAGDGVDPRRPSGRSINAAGQDHRHPDPGAGRDRPRSPSSSSTTARTPKPIALFRIVTEELKLRNLRPELLPQANDSAASRREIRTTRSTR